MATEDYDWFDNIDIDQQKAILEAIEKRESSFSKSSSTKAQSSSAATSSIAKKPNDSLLSPEWELIDPNPDVFALFVQWDERFFKSKLQSSGVEVRWSPRMTLCAGQCHYHGGSGQCSVRLSVPLLKLRPRSDLVNTLLHEMIHAYLFVTRNNRDRDGHGPEFQKHMQRINIEGGTKITIYHSFHEEVKLYKQHWWRCSGPCKDQHPFYGWVKRSMNRAPGPNDLWWKDHQSKCNGTFIKVKEPDPPLKKVKEKPSSKVKDAVPTKKPKISPVKSSTQDIRSFISVEARSPTSSSDVPLPIAASPQIALFSGEGQKLGGAASQSRLLNLFPPKPIGRKK